MIIGLTGLFGSGKSEVAAVWEKLGAEAINADALGREVVKNDPMVFYRLILEFGPSIIGREGRLDRHRLGLLAFASRERTEVLNAIVHPPLLERLDRRIAQARRRKRPLVIDAALLVFWGYHRRVDGTVLVTATRENRYRRLKRRGFSEEEILRRSRSQLPEAALRRSADHILANNKDLLSLQKKAALLFRRLAERG